MMKQVLFGVLVVITLLPWQPLSEAADAAGWKSRVVYQVLTDRYAQTGDAPTEECTDLMSWCGGTWRGIANNLDYIQNLGADAIWISPIVYNTRHSYHAYHALNIYEMEPNFGTEEDLHYLVEQAHARDMWIMVDVVPNHMGHETGCNETGCYPDEARGDFSKYTPFNLPEYYHEYCEWDGDNDNQIGIETCRLFNLPDLNQTHPYVRQALLDWITNLTRTYDIDGYRVDTTRHIAMDFWPEYQVAAEAFCIGEVWNEDDMAYIASYQLEGELDALFQFPLHSALNKVFRDGQPFSVLDGVIKEARAEFADVEALGLFVDNHDMARFLNTTQDVAKFKNALTYVMFGEGIPFIYYGSEQGFSGGGDPDCRESLWPHYDQQSVLYTFIKASLDFRRMHQGNIVGNPQAELLVGNDVMVFSRGTMHNVLVALTKVGMGSDTTATLSNLDLPDDTVYANAMDNSEEIVIQNGEVTIALTNGEPKVYIMKALGPGGSAGTIKAGSLAILASVVAALTLWQN